MLKGSKGCYQFHICMLCFSRLVYEAVCTNRGKHFHPYFDSVKKIVCDWLTLLLRIHALLYSTYCVF